jgi:hypothetical protein
MQCFSTLSTSLSRSIKILFNGLRKEWDGNHHHHLNDKMHFSLNPNSLVVVEGGGGVGRNIFFSPFSCWISNEWQNVNCNSHTSLSLSLSSSIIIIVVITLFALIPISQNAFICAFDYATAAAAVCKKKVKDFSCGWGKNIKIEKCHCDLS